MTSGAKPVIAVQVRELVEFALRRGDLGSGGEFVGPGRALAGIRGHQRVQRSRPAQYQREVRVAQEVDGGDFVLRVQGRIDGVVATRDGVLLEEIKTVRGNWQSAPRKKLSRFAPQNQERQSGVFSLSSAQGEGREEEAPGAVRIQGAAGREADPLHWAQAKCYGFMYARRHSLEKLSIQLTYFDLDTGQATEWRDSFSLADLASVFEEATAVYLAWLRERREWCRRRDASIAALAFPFPAYRPGQRQLAVAVYRALAQGARLFLEAPTGIGKTVSVLFPAVKAMGEGELERIFYLTARTVGRTVAERALAELRQAGLRLRTLTLTAKEKVCAQAGQPCDPAACPLAQGYYDRCKGAIRAALAHEAITRTVIEAVGREHQVCPFELSLEVSLWVDAVICDYNYVFDPAVYLRRHFGEEPRDYAFLVDEAHNLVDRAREMFSAELERREIQEACRAVKEALPRCARALSRLSSALRQVCGEAATKTGPAEDDAPGLELDLFRAAGGEGGGGRRKCVAWGAGGADIGGRKAEPRAPAQERVQEEHGGDLRATSGLGVRPKNYEQDARALGLPVPLLAPLEGALKEMENWLARNQPAAFRQQLLQLYYRLQAFQRTAELFDERYVTLAEAGARGRVRLFCLDPSRLLRQALERGRAAVFFSATLTPLDYYRDLLGGEAADGALRLASPFPPDNLAVLVQESIGTRLKERAATLAAVAEAIRAVTSGRAGNYLAYFPSYQYLTAVQERFRALCPAARLLAQRPGMSEAEREEFLAAFSAEHGETRVGFAVMGGVFGEGIDLVGERLIGAIIVGVGLPQLCLERDLIRDYFQERTGAGFDYAYVFPGMNRVLQAAGRVIRSETDRGVVLLVDRRFAEARYRRLFPGWWRVRRVRNGGGIGEWVRSFWGRALEQCQESLK